MAIKGEGYKRARFRYCGQLVEREREKMTVSVTTEYPSQARKKMFRDTCWNFLNPCEAPNRAEEGNNPLWRE